MTDTIIMAFITAMSIVTPMMTITISHTQASEGSFDRRTELMVRVRALLSKGQGCDRKGRRALSSFLPAAGIFAARPSSGPSLQFGLRVLETFGVNLQDT